MSDVRIEARVVIRELLDGRSARAVLPNGKVIVAYARKGDPDPRLRAGEERTVRLSLCDFGRGRLAPDGAQAPSPPALGTGASSAS